MDDSILKVLYPIGQGATFGYLPELAASARQGVNSIQNTLGYEKSFGNYEDELSALSQQYADIAAENPYRDIALQLLGGAPLGELGGLALGSAFRSPIMNNEIGAIIPKTSKKFETALKKFADKNDYNFTFNKSKSTRSAYANLEKSNPSELYEFRISDHPSGNPNQWNANKSAVKIREDLDINGNPVKLGEIDIRYGIDDLEEIFRKILGDK